MPHLGTRTGRRRIISTNTSNFNKHRFGAQLSLLSEAVVGIVWCWQTVLMMTMGQTFFWDATLYLFWTEFALTYRPKDSPYIAHSHGIVFAPTLVGYRGSWIQAPFLFPRHQQHLRSTYLISEMDKLQYLHLLNCEISERMLISIGVELRRVSNLGSAASHRPG